MGYGLVSVSTAAVATILTANTSRLGLIICNIGSHSAYIASDASVTSANGIKLLPNGTFTEDSGGQRVYLGAYYAIAGSAGTQLTYWERSV